MMKMKQMMKMERKQSKRQFKGIASLLLSLFLAFAVANLAFCASNSSGGGANSGGVANNNGSGGGGSGGSGGGDMTNNNGGGDMTNKPPVTPKPRPANTYACANTGTKITTQAQLQAIGETGKNAADYYLANDITLDATFTPITRYSGTLDGCAWIVKNLRLTSTAINTGLVRILETGGTIRNLGVEGVMIATNHDNTGALAGLNQGTISTSYAIGTISKTGTTNVSNLGGLVGLHAGGTISEAYADVTITKANTITTSTPGSNTGKLTSVGGLVGFQLGAAIIRNTFATGGAARSIGNYAADMTTNQNEIHIVGGLVGRVGIVSVGASLSPIIENNYSLANIEAGSKAGQTPDGANTASVHTFSPNPKNLGCAINCGGGLLGQDVPSSDQATTVKNNFAAGQVITQSSVDTTAVNHAGGLAGRARDRTNFTGKNYFVSEVGGSDGIGDHGDSSRTDGEGCSPSGTPLANNAAASAAICIRLMLSALQAINQATDLSWNTAIWSKTGEANTWPCLANIVTRFGALNRGCPSDPS